MASDAHTILVVDDEPLIRDMLVDMLDADGFDVLEAHDADHAMVVIDRRPDIRVVLTDIQMPGSMNGLELAHILRGIHPTLGLIISSGATFPGSTELPPLARFFSKPFEMVALSGAVRELIDCPVGT